MATGTFASRPGGFTVKTAAQTLSSRQKDQIRRNIQAPVNVITGDTTLTVANQIAVFTKGSAAAIVLPAPTAGTDDGVEMRLVSGSAFAHVITGTGLIDDGVTGGAKNTITLGAFVGATAMIVAYNGHWVLASKTVATVA